MYPGLESILLKTHYIEMSKASYNLHNISLIRHSLTVDACGLWTCIISDGLLKWYLHQSTTTSNKRM